jgi:hypothetical protein
MAHVACHCEIINAAVHAARLKSSLSIGLRAGFAQQAGLHGGGARYCLKHTAINWSCAGFAQQE